MTTTHQTYHPLRFALTLIEVMLAMTLSLVMMLALAATFKLVGDRITKSQSDLDLSGNIREIAATLRQEMRRSTLGGNLNPPVSDGSGYLVYHEGPMTSQTASQVSLGLLETELQQRINAQELTQGQANEILSSTDYFQFNRYGDLDDYLAFTANAANDSPFMGYIPYGVLAAKIFAEGRAKNPGFVLNMPSGPYTEADALRLVPFYSTQAEIAYWLSPEWETIPYRDPETGRVNPGYGTLAYGDDGKPIFRDRGAGNDLLPDRLNLHRRVLLIRDDLNLKQSDIYIANSPSGNTPPTGVNDFEVLPFLRPNQQIVPINQAPEIVEDFGPGNWESRVSVNSPNWLVGLARLQQVMDLSMSRVINRVAAPQQWTNTVLQGNGQPNQANPTPSRVNQQSLYGMPSQFVRANSLQGGDNDVTRPQNRFAHVRMPETLLGNTLWRASTMPLIALSPPSDFITANRSSLGTARAMPSQADPGGGQSYGKFTMVGCLRPEFNLTERFIHPDSGNLVVVERGGDDVIAKNVLSFDVQVFDPDAPTFAWVGPDGEEGFAGTDDNLDTESSYLNNNFDLSELGWVGSDDEFVRINDLTAREIVTQADNGAQSAPRFGINPIGQGGFVDLNCLRLSGAPLGGTVGVPQLSNLTAMNLLSPSFVGGGAQPVVFGQRTVIGYPRATQQSGRFVLQRSSTDFVNSFYQPVFDTWSSAFLNDGFDQEGLVNVVWQWPGVGNGRPPIIPPGQAIQALKNYRAFNGNLTTERLGESPPVPVSAVSWSNMLQTDFGGFEDNGPLNQGWLASGSDRIDIRPPVEATLQGIQIQIRLIDPATGQIRQQTILEKF